MTRARCRWRCVFIGATRYVWMRVECTFCFRKNYLTTHSSKGTMRCRRCGTACAFALDLIDGRVP